MKCFVGNLILLSLSSVVFIGCGTEPAPQVSAQPKIDGTPYLLNAEPSGGSDVIAVRKDAKDAEDIVIVGRIGGDANPWIEGRAAFTIVDPSLRACSDIPGDACPQPWDYCCEMDKLPDATALVQVVDQEGQVVKADARELLSVKELQTVVVKGKAKRDDQGNLEVLASGIYVKK